MKKYLLAVLIILTVVTTSLAQNILPYAIHQKQLPNGLKIVTVPYDSPGLVSFHIVVRVGSRDETETGVTGFAHFFEHMMFRGTEKYSKEAYSLKLKSTGASANANTDLDRTVYHMTGSVQHLETMFELESDRFMNLKYSLQGFKTEAGAVKGEYTKGNASPYGKLDEAFNDSAFDKHTYKHTTIGFFKDIVDMPNQYDYSMKFFDRYYRPEYCTVVVVGDVLPETVEKLALKYFGNWKAGNFKQQIPVEPPQTGTRYANVKVEQFPPYLTLGFKGPAFSVQNNDYQALRLLTQILCSEKSPLYNKLVITEQKVRSMDAGIAPTRDPYVVSFNASLASANDLAYVKKEFLSAIATLKQTPLDAKVLSDAKERIRYSFSLSIDNPNAVADALDEVIWLTGNPESLNKSFDLISKVTPADIMRVAKKYLNVDQLTIGTVSPTDKPVLD